MSTPKRVIGKKLLVASIGVAAISYAACTPTEEVTGNPVAPAVDASAGPADTGIDAKDDALISSGNLVAPLPDDAGPDAKDATDEDAFIGSGNLVPPPDSGAD
jgi:hypothetical protein